MQCVEGVEPQVLKERGALGRAWAWDHDLIRERKQSGNIMPPVRIRVAGDLDLQCSAAHLGYLSFTYQAKNAFNRFGFVANAGLALIVSQTVQTTGIQVKSQSQSFLRAAIAPRTGTQR